MARVLRAIRQKLNVTILVSFKAFDSVRIPIRGLI